MKPSSVKINVSIYFGAFFVGEKSDAISPEVLILGISFVMFYSKGSEVSPTESLS